MRTLFLVFCVALLAASMSHAQVVGARAVEFVASPDHARLLPDGRPALSEYELELYSAGAAVPFHRASLGKPVPGASQVVQFDFSPLVAGWPLPGGTYQARVAAAGPLGRSVSGPSNTFTLEGPGCSPIVSPASVTLPADGGTALVSLTATSACRWIAASGDAWITPSPASGTGTASIVLAVAPNPGSTSRSATVLVAGRPVTVVQSGPVVEDTCTYRLRPAQVTLEASGATMPVSLRTEADCAWTVASPVRWLRPELDGGSGSAVVDVLARPHTGTYARTGSVTIAGRVFAVTQLGTCAPSLSPGSLSFGAAGGTATVGVSVPDGCNWAVSSDRAWASAAPASGTDTGTVTVAVGPNPRSSGRRALVDVGDRPLEISQEAGPAAPAPEVDTFRYTLDLDDQAGAGSLVLSIANPLERAVTASIGGSGAAVPSVAVTIPARSQVEVRAPDPSAGAVTVEFITVASDGPLAVVGSSRGEGTEAAPPACTAVPARVSTAFTVRDVPPALEGLRLRLTNPNAAEARVLVRATGGDGFLQTRRVGVAPFSTATVRVPVPARIGARGESLRLVVEATNGWPVAVEREAAGAPRPRTAPESETPAHRWVLAGADAGGLGRAPAWLRLGNPGAASVSLDVTSLPETGTAASQTRSLTLGRGETRQVDLSELFPEAVGQGFGVLIAAREAGAVLVASLVTERGVVSPGVPIR